MILKVLAFTKSYVPLDNHPNFGRMKVYLLSPKHRLFKVDNLFLAKAPLMPNRYLWEKKGYQIAIMQAEDSDNLVLCSDNDAFTNRYLDYYRERFELEELESLPSGAQNRFGFVELQQNAAIETEEE